MTKTKFHRHEFALRAALIFCLAPVVVAQTATVEARDAWVRLPLPSKNETALYVTVENHSAQKREIVSASSEVADRVELHEMKMIKTMMAMTPVSQVALPARGKAVFDPNGFHIMLFALKSKLAVGDKVNATLTLDDGTTLSFTADVRKK